MRRSNPVLQLPLYGLLRGACHRARIRATRWLAMTVYYASHSQASSPAKAGDPVFQRRPLGAGK